MGLKDWIVKIAVRKLAKKINLQEGVVDKKKWYLSKTLWSNVVVVLIGTYELVKANIVPGLPGIPPIVLTILGALGVYSRATATKPLGL